MRNDSNTRLYGFTCIIGTKNHLIQKFKILERKDFKILKQCKKIMKTNKFKLSLQEMIRKSLSCC